MSCAAKGLRVLEPDPQYGRKGQGFLGPEQPDGGKGQCGCGLTLERFANMPPLSEAFCAISVARACEPSCRSHHLVPRPFGLDHAGPCTFGLVLAGGCFVFG